MIIIENKKKSKKTLTQLYPNAEVIDLTSKGDEPFIKLSPFYPHGKIPVPFSENIFAYSVEGIWQGLKVFKGVDIDISKFEIKDMKGIKRTARKFGQPIGHRKGIKGIELLDYLEARKQIYLPSYAWLLQNLTTNIIELLRNKAETHDLILLDYETNSDIEDTSRPLSHAALVKKYLEKKYPEILNWKFSKTEQTKENKTATKKNKPKTISNSPKEEIKKNQKNQLSLGFD